MHSSQTRRTFIKSLIAISVSVSLLNSCKNMMGSGGFPDTSGDYIDNDLLTIDSHAHVFNAADIPGYSFIKYVLMDGVVIPGVNTLIWLIVGTLSHIAVPGYKAEAQRLNDSLNPQASILGLEKVWKAEDLDTQQKAEDFLNSKIDEIYQRQLKSTKHHSLLSDEEKEFIEQVNSEIGLREIPKSLGIINWVRRLIEAAKLIERYISWTLAMLRYRYQQIDEIMKTYKKIKVFTPALVDFDNWFESSSGKVETRVSIREQMQLSVLHAKKYKGAVMPFVAYDPLRDVKNNGQTLKDTIDYLSNYGAIGVKIYPPMGFRVYGNIGLTFCNIDINNLGEKLDQRLLALYKYCAKNDIPILAHTARSNKNGICNDDYIDRANPKHWQEVLKMEECKNLRINLGHFATHSKLENNEWSDSIRYLITTYENVYADLSHIEELGASRYRSIFFRELKRFITSSTEADAAKIRSRLMYGSDWIMLRKEKVSKRYFDLAIAEYAKISPLELRKEAVGQFAGENAYAFMALSTPSVQSRFKRFFDKNEISYVSWINS
jgi:predicted TIM-barrel fold metal-dependent hydrolase